MLHQIKIFYFFRLCNNKKKNSYPKNTTLKIANSVKNEKNEVTPIRSVLSQLKISEENWKREKVKNYSINEA